MEQNRLHVDGNCLAGEWNEIMVGDNLALVVSERRTFTHALRRPLPHPKFKEPLRRPELIFCDLDFIFLDVEMD